MSYRIVRMYQSAKADRTIKRGLTLEEAQKHCSDPETSSRTAVKRAGTDCTRKHGPWFDGYTDK
jgi:hypothetical protein